MDRSGRDSRLLLVEQVIAALKEELPPVIARKELPKYLGGTLAKGTLANLGLKSGPPYVRRGKHAIYEKTSFLAWYREWLLADGQQKRT